MDKRRKIREKKNGGIFRITEWNGMKKFFLFSCLSCQKTEPEIKLTIDHVVPISKGGQDSIFNIQPLCFSCNARKHDKIIDYRNSTHFQDFIKFVKKLK